MEKIIWNDRVKNEEVLQVVNEDRNILQEIKGTGLTGLIISRVGTAF